MIDDRENSRIEQLGKIVGDENVIYGNVLGQRHPGYCETSQQASCLVRPATVEELSTLATFAHANNIALVPQGGLTGLVNGTAAKRDNVIVSLERMNKVLRVDPVQGILIAQAGARLQEIQSVAADYGLVTGVDIPSRGSCTVGGIVSTNAGGIRVIRYGMTRESILGLTAVMADGTVIDANNTLMKNNAGFDLKQLFIGSEGTLGIVAEAVFKLYPKPVSETTALVAVKDVDDVLTLLSNCRLRLGAGLLSFEVMWHEHYAGVCANPDLGKAPLAPDYPLYAIVEAAEQSTEDSILSNEQSVEPAESPLQRILGDALESELLLDGVVAQSEKERAQIWSIREDADYLKSGYHELHSYDVGFELKDIDAFVKQLKVSMSERWPDLPVYVFGHLGDGNLHIVLPLSWEHHQNSDQFDRVIYEVVGQFDNSTISAEHGIGMLKKPYLKQSRSDAQVELMKLLKQTLDPQGVLNPGKIF